MPWILQLCLIVLFLLGAGNPAWGKASAAPAAAEWGSAPSSAFDRGSAAPPALLASGQAAAWGLDVASSVQGQHAATPTMAGPVVVTFRGAAFLVCPSSIPPPTASFGTTNQAWVAVGPNVYAYVKQNPWTAFDPLGLAAGDPYDTMDDAMVNASRDIWYHQPGSGEGSPQKVEYGSTIYKEVLRGF
jgi:hypothetical protein